MMQQQTDFLSDAEVLRRLDEAVAGGALSERNRAIFILREGLGGERGHFYREVAERFGLSAQRIRQLHQEQVPRRLGLRWVYDGTRWGLVPAEVCCREDATHVIRGEEPVTWGRLVARIPELAHLRREAQKTSDADPHFCANYVWYRPGGLKERLSQLVGWGVASPDPMVRSSEAYDLAYDILYNALPDCRDCGCARSFSDLFE